MPDPPINSEIVPMIPAAIATAQMRRDREALVQAQAQIAELRKPLQYLQSLPPYRVYTSARRAYQHLPAGIRMWIRRAWVRRPKAEPADPASEQASQRPRGRALVIDDHWPQPDRDSGSIDIVNLVHALGELGFDVILAAARQHDGPWPGRDALMRGGLRCLLPSDATSVDEFLVRQGHSLDLYVLCRVYCGGRFLEAVRRHALAARVIFNTIDLAFLREERRAETTDDAALRAAVRDVRAREEEIIRGSEATLVVSRAEFDLLAKEIPEALVAEMPLARALTPPSASFAQRAGIGFIGGFAHAPNVDGMRYFLAEIWPLVLRDLPDLELTIVGADFPDEMLASTPGRVRSLGHMPDVIPWFEGLRLTIAPLRFGAGAKGKVASSLAAGVPCIATSVAAEGMSLSEAAGVLVENDPAAFAVRLRDAYTDEALWNRLSTGGLAYAAETLSLSRWRDRLDALLRQIGL